MIRKFIVSAVFSLLLISAAQGDQVVFWWETGLPSGVTEENYWTFLVKDQDTGAVVMANISKLEAWSNDRRAVNLTPGHSVKIFLYNDDDNYPPAVVTPPMLRTGWMTVPEGGKVYEFKKQRWIYSPEGN